MNRDSKLMTDVEQHLLQHLWYDKLPLTEREFVFNTVYEIGIRAFLDDVRPSTFYAIGDYTNGRLHLENLKKKSCS